jgi:hypothetical protein
MVLSISRIEEFVARIENKKPEAERMDSYS